MMIQITKPESFLYRSRNSGYFFGDPNIDTWTIFSSL